MSRWPFVLAFLAFTASFVSVVVRTYPEGGVLGWGFTIVAGVGALVTFYTAIETMFRWNAGTEQEQT